jgi:ubiquinone/menaquinone biosynthesis C-methylase UbiE
MSSFEKFFVKRTSERTARKFLEMMKESNLTIQSGKCSILELGAGRGTLSYSLYHSLSPERLVVTDYDPSQIRLTELYFRTKLGNIPENVEIRTADAQSLPFSNDSFDGVIASHVLHHVEKREWHFKNIPSALSEIHRVLKPEGYFIFEEIYSTKQK